MRARQIARRVDVHDDVQAKAEAIGVPQEQIDRGHHAIADVRLDDGERVTTHRTLMNRGGTAIERWLSNDPAGLFTPGARSAIEMCQHLWARIDKKGPPPVIRGAKAYLWLGQSEHEAIAELALLKERFPYKFWSVFENVCRFDVDAAGAGMDLATNSRSATDAAKTCVAFVAGMIATWKGL